MLTLGAALLSSWEVWTYTQPPPGFEFSLILLDDLGSCMFVLIHNITYIFPPVVVHFIFDCENFSFNGS